MRERFTRQTKKKEKGGRGEGENGQPHMQTGLSQVNPVNGVYEKNLSMCCNSNLLKLQKKERGRGEGREEMRYLVCS